MKYTLRSSMWLQLAWQGELPELELITSQRQLPLEIYSIDTMVKAVYSSSTHTLTSYFLWFSLINHLFRDWYTALSDETRNFIRDRYQDFFWDQSFRDRYRDFFLRPNIFETDTQTFFWDQMFSRLIPRLFSRPNVFETYTKTFFETRYFWDRYRDFF